MSIKIIVCLDGTWNSTINRVKREDGSYVLKPTNPLKLARAVRPLGADGRRQITYYDSGVGTAGIYTGDSNKILGLIDRGLGGIWGAGFEANVEQAARFLADNIHVDGDEGEDPEVFVFGFSRGAAQARALTNFIDWLGGMTPKKDAYYLPLFYQHYISTRGTGDKREIKRRRDGYIPADHVVPVSVKLLGVFDTVLALGSRLNAAQANADKDRSFHVRKRPASCVRHARHAIAIDEERYDFRAEIWEGKSDATITMEQRWFPGVHGNVGGSYERDGLANCALNWIADAARKLELEFDEDWLGHYHPFSGHAMGDSYTPFYKVFDWWRERRGMGRRNFVQQVGDAKIDIDKSAIERACRVSSDEKYMDKAYRPDGLVKLFREAKGDPETFLKSFGVNTERFSFPDDI